jgi:hypothetical protein
MIEIAGRQFRYVTQRDHKAELFCGWLYNEAGECVAGICYGETEDEVVQTLRRAYIAREKDI